MQEGAYCHQPKVAIIGAGKVGATCAFSIMTETEVNEIVLIDTNKKKANAEVLDLNHGLAFSKNKEIRAGDYKDLTGADFIIITAGVAQNPGETRLELASRNYQIIKEIMTEAVKHNKEGIYIIVSNPVDILTYAAQQISGLPRTQIFGSGTNLDSSRFRYLIGEELDLSPNEINAYILGEHGDSEFPLKSQVSINGLNINSIKELPKVDLDACYAKTKNAAYEVIEGKGATYYAIALSIVDILNEIMHDQNAINPLSVCLEGEYGIEGIALSVPVIVNRSGIKQVLEIDMTVEEQFKLKDSAEKLKEVYDSVASG